MRGTGPETWVRLKGLSREQRRWAWKQLILAMGEIILGTALLYFMFASQGPTPMHP